MKQVQHHKLSIKIFLSLGLIIFIIIGIYSIVFDKHYKKYEDKIIREENIKTLYSLEMSIASMISNVDEYSKMLIADNVIQEYMKSGDIFANVAWQSEMTKKIYSIFQFSDYVEAVWLIDNKGQKLTVGGSANILLEEEFEDYMDLKKPYGTYRISINEDGKKQTLSLVRSYNNLEDFSSLGIIGVDIDCSVFDSLIAGVVDVDTEQFTILNEQNQVVYTTGNISNDFDWVMNIEGKQKEVLENISINKTEYIRSGITSSVKGWKVIRYVPIKTNQESSEIVRFNMTLIAGIGVLILLSAAVVSSMLTGPIQQLLYCMKGIEGGKLQKIRTRPILDEFRVLFKGYNHMVDEMERLLQSTIDKQRRIRQVEMNEMQEQMKPHFLYNTLDSIQALAMIGDSNKVCTLVEALGDFYRKSVSGGRELLTVEEEFQIVKDYVEIMKIRFEDSFDFQADIPDLCKEYRIPKLTIQPLVENSFQHAVRISNQYGRIHVGAKIEDKALHIWIKDNGNGIPQEIIEELHSNKEPVKGKSLGLRGTIERLRLLYGDDFNYTIKNDEMTEVNLVIALGKLKEIEYGENEGSVVR